MNVVMILNGMLYIDIFVVYTYIYNTNQYAKFYNLYVKSNLNAFT